VYAGGRPTTGSVADTAPIIAAADTPGGDSAHVGNDDGSKLIGWKWYFDKGLDDNGAGGDAAVIYVQVHAIFWT
jgi:hypothetical protein